MGIERYVALRITNERVPPTQKPVTPINQPVTGKTVKRTATGDNVATKPVSGALVPPVPQGKRFFIAVIVSIVAFLLSGASVAEVLRNQSYQTSNRLCSGPESSALWWVCSPSLAFLLVQIEQFAVAASIASNYKETLPNNRLRPPVAALAMMRSEFGNG